MRPSLFVGRHGELLTVRDRLGAAAGGAGQVVLISGEPGIGKTSLATEVAATSGTTVCWGRAVQDDGSPPYWPFRQVVRTLARTHAPGALAGDLALVAPEVGPTRPITSPEERFRVFEAVTEYLTGAAAENGLLVVLDDVQWADPPTLQLLVHVARAVRDSRLVIVATYRDTESRDAMSATLAALAREDAVTRVRLVGLTEAEVAAQLTGLTGGPVAEDVAAVVSRRTQGNPFFVAELGRLLDADTLPEAVRDAARARLGTLSPLCQDVLAAGSVLGNDLDPTVLAVVLDRPVQDVLTALDEATAAGVVQDNRFAHDLVRDAARLDVPTTRRLAVHRRIAEYLETRPDARSRAVEIAHHWHASLPAGDHAKAAAWAERAADTAMAQLAWENAADLYARALDATPDPLSRARLLCGQGTAQLRQFDFVAGLVTLKQAAELARDSGDADAIAEVALAMEGVNEDEWITTGKALCDEALAVLPKGDNPLRARLLAQRAADAAFVAAPGAADDSAEALAIADRSGDPRALRSALRARQLARSGPDGVTERLALGDRMLAVGLADDDAEAVLWGRLWRFDALCQLARIDEAEAELLPVGRAADRMRTPVAKWHHVRSQLVVEQARGNFAKAREHALTSLDLVRNTGGPVVYAVSVSMLATAAAATGDDAEILAEYEPYLAHPPEMVAVMVGGWHAECGRLDIARRCYLPNQLREPIGGMRYLNTVMAFAHLAELFDDRDTLARAYEMLLPHGDLVVCGGAGVVTVHGAAHGPLGVAATALGRLDDAVRHLRRAIEINERAGMRPFVAHNHLDLAKALGRRKRPGDEAEADALATSAAALADQLGMKRLVRQARELTRDTPGPLSRRELEIARLVAQGLTNKQIAASTHISVRTVETHVQHILAKLGLATRTQIATQPEFRA